MVYALAVRAFASIGSLLFLAFAGFMASRRDLASAQYMMLVAIYFELMSQYRPFP
jgi:hypothetical protein